MYNKIKYHTTLAFRALTNIKKKELNSSLFYLIDTYGNRLCLTDYLNAFLLSISANNLLKKVL